MGMVEQSPWPESNFSKALDLALRQLRTDPTLQASGITWQTWSGLDDREDTRPFTWDDLPAIRVTPTLGQAEWNDNVSHRFPLVLTFDLYVRGTRIQALFDLWAAMIAALFPGTEYGTLNDAFITSAGCYARTATGPIPSLQTFDAGQLGLRGTAAIRFEVRIDT